MHDRRPRAIARQYVLGLSGFVTLEHDQAPDRFAGDVSHVFLDPVVFAKRPDGDKGLVFVQVLDLRHYSQEALPPYDDALQE
jgi:hypothetical protein